MSTIALYTHIGIYTTKKTKQKNLVILLTLNKSELKLVILLTLNKSSNTINKIPLGETGCLCIFFFLRPLFFFFFECLGIQFFDSPLLFTPLTQSVRLSTPYGYLPLTVQPLCDLRDVMPCHWSPGASHLSPLTSSLTLL